MITEAASKNATFTRISGIVENAIQEDSQFQQELDPEEMISIVYTTIEENLSAEQLHALDDRELTRRIKKMLVLELVSGMLDDLSPEEMENFDAAVEGRW